MVAIDQAGAAAVAAAAAAADGIDVVEPINDPPRRAAAMECRHLPRCLLARACSGGLRSVALSETMLAQINEGILLNKGILYS